MASGSFYLEKGTGNASWKSLQGRVDWSSTPNGSVANTSTVTTKLYARTWTGGTSGRNWSGNVKVGSNTAHSFSKMDSTWANKDIAESYVLFQTYTDTVQHADDGSCSVTIAATINGCTGTSLEGVKSTGSQTVTLDKIARQATLVTASNINDEQSPTITYSNPAGESVDKIEACIADENGATIFVPYREVSKTAGSYTFNFTDDERNALRQAATSNTLTIRYVLKTTIDGVAITPFSYSNKTLTLVNHTPTVNPTIVDTNEKTIALTGDANKLVRYHSTALATINASARKYASITGQRITNGSTAVSGATATFTNVSNSNFIFYAKDSRNNAVTKNVSLTTDSKWIEYVHLTCNAQPSNPTAEGNMALNISGNYWNGNFGTENNVLTLQYRMTAEGTDFGDWITVTPTLNGNTYNVNVPITGLDYQTTYKFEVKAIDKLETTPVKTFSVRTKTIYDWSDEDFQFNVPVNVDGDITNTGNISTESFINAKGNVRTFQKFVVPNSDGGGIWNTTDSPILRDHGNGNVTLNATSQELFLGHMNTTRINMFNGKYYFNTDGNVYVHFDGYNKKLNPYRVGDIIITSTNTNPGNDYQGTWELIDKEFKARYIFSSDTTYVTRDKSSAMEIRIDYTGHNINLNIIATSNAQINDDTTYTLGTLNLTALGINGDLGHAYFTTGFTAAGNCIVMMQLLSGGAMQILDLIPDDYISSGRTFYYNYTITVNKDVMINSFCDKFYWKRTA